MNEAEAKSVIGKVWDERVQAVATRLQAECKGVVLVAIFDAPWMAGADPGVIGLAGGSNVDTFRVARDLRATADILEKHTADIHEGRAFVEERERKPAVRE